MAQFQALWFFYLCLLFSAAAVNAGLMQREADGDLLSLSIGLPGWSSPAPESPCPTSSKRHTSTKPWSTKTKTKTSTETCKDSTTSSSKSHSSSSTSRETSCSTSLSSTTSTSTGLTSSSCPRAQTVTVSVTSNFTSTVTSVVPTTVATNLTSTVTSIVTATVIANSTLTAQTTTITVCPTTQSTSTSSSSTTSTVPPHPTFSCPKEGYNTGPDGTTFESVDISTGQVKTINNNLNNGDGVNALGYNILDNTFYGVQNSNRAVVHIFSDGHVEATNLRVPSAPNLGDIDLNGHFFVSRAGTDWHEFDVDPKSPTFSQEVASGTSAAPPDGVTVNDWTSVPVTGPYFYSLVGNETSGGAAIVRWNSETHVWSAFANYPDLKVDVWAPVFGANNGTLYGVDYGTGEIYNFDLVGPGKPFVISKTPSLLISDDAARCGLNVNP